MIAEIQKFYPTSEKEKSKRGRIGADEEPLSLAITTTTTTTNAAGTTTTTTTTAKIN